jgi:hypothetical protein
MAAMPNARYVLELLLDRLERRWLTSPSDLLPQQRSTVD